MQHSEIFDEWFTALTAKYPLVADYRQETWAQFCDFEKQKKNGEPAELVECFGKEVEPFLQAAQDLLTQHQASLDDTVAEHIRAVNDIVRNMY